MSDLTFVSRAASWTLKGLVTRISGYSAKSEPSVFLEAAELVFPLVFNLGQPWAIRLGKEGDFYCKRSFTAGLFAGPVALAGDAGAELLQVDLTPLGAARLFGGAAADLAGQVVDLSEFDRFGGEYDAIHDQLNVNSDWHVRFDLIERFLALRFKHPNSSRIQASWRLLAQGKSVAETAAAIGWSTRHLSAQFSEETGIRPITAARMLRFQRARALALTADNGGWADIAAATGFSDQAHLIRTFHDFAGEPPKAWAKRARPTQTHLQV